MKKLLAILMAVSVVFLFSCSNDSSDSGNSSESDSNNESSTEDTKDLLEADFSLNLIKINDGYIVYNDTEPKTISKKIGTTITLPNTDCYYYAATSIDPLYYDFVGWTTSPDGTGTIYKAGDKFTLTKNITFYAKYLTRDTFTGTDFEHILIGRWDNDSNYIMFNTDFTGELYLDASVFYFDWCATDKETEKYLTISNATDSNSNKYDDLNKNYTINSLSSTELKIKGNFLSDSSEETTWNNKD